MPNNGRFELILKNDHFEKNLNAVNDQFAIGDSLVMSDYCNVFDYIDQYTYDGIPFTGENMLGYHLWKHDINVPSSSFEVHLRKYHHPNQNIDYGRWS
jgi:hypothetical protein